MREMTDILSVLTCLSVLVGLCGCKCPCGPSKAAPKSAASLAAPAPAVPATRKLSDFDGKLSKTLTMADAKKTLGEPDSITGRKMVIYVYRLADGRELHLGFLPGTPLQYAKVKAPDGKLTDIELK